MASELTPVGKFAKWVLLPLLLAAIGFFLIGPRIGNPAVDKKAEAAGPEPSSVQTPKPDSTPPPTVDVTVKPAPDDSNSNAAEGMPPEPTGDSGQIQTAPKVRHRKHHVVSDTNSSAPPVAPPADTTPPGPKPEEPDAGGSGGAAGPPNTSGTTGTTG